ncbi:hypothetical protein [Hahella ganghwensis]|uniref:hypothetical protein n=1 Tax=Hahella ganghwensis TaxID=286420 RepID=UPI00036DB91C|nr:hypothetical protein [Hahella ganghwensis]
MTMTIDKVLDHVAQDQTSTGYLVEDSGIQVQIIFHDGGGSVSLLASFEDGDPTALAKIDEVPDFTRSTMLRLSPAPNTYIYAKTKGVDDVSVIIGPHNL